MSMSALEQRSGTFRIMGFDFMLDDKMNLWFIEANTSPQITQTDIHRRQFTELMIRDALEIEFALLRSRVQRLREFVRTAGLEYREKRDNWDQKSLTKMFEAANKEKLEDGYTISTTNQWAKIIDLSLEGGEENRYLGNLHSSCFVN